MAAPPAVAVGENGQIASVLRQKRMEAFVVGRRQIELEDKGAITADRLSESAVDEFGHVVTGQLPPFERVVHDRPEILARGEALPHCNGRW